MTERPEPVDPSAGGELTIESVPGFPGHCTVTGVRGIPPPPDVEPPIAHGHSHQMRPLGHFEPVEITQDTLVDGIGVAMARIQQTFQESLARHLDEIITNGSGVADSTTLTTAAEPELPESHTPVAAIRQIAIEPARHTRDLSAILDDE
jgi:hypothetical protein